MKQIMYFFLLSILAQRAYAQVYQYELKGSFRPDFLRPRMMEYVLRWSEEKGTIKGTYSDNFFAPAAKVTGEASASGRVFYVKFSEKKEGINSLSILTSASLNQETAKTIPLAIITNDDKGNPLAALKVSSLLTTRPARSVAQLQEENPCVDGFGVLGGYCGVYAGVVAEEQDRRNTCNLLFADAVRLELTPEGMVMLHLGEVADFVKTPSHVIGRVPVNPQKSTIDLMSRICGPISGVNSSGSSCKILHLKGGFSLVSDLRHFRGEYLIHEEGTNNSCRYSFSMDRLR